MKFKKGDCVTHKCGSPRGEMDAIFSHYIDPADHYFSEQRVAVTYTCDKKKDREGDWLEKYCISLDKVKPKTKPKSPKEQGKPMPQQSEFPTDDRGYPLLEYHQIFYAWRGYNGCGNSYSYEKYYEWENRKRNSHKTDPAKPKDNKWDWCEDIINEMDKKEVYNPFELNAEQLKAWEETKKSYYDRNCTRYQVFKELRSGKLPVYEEQWEGKNNIVIGIGDTVCRKNVSKETAVVKEIFTNDEGIDSVLVEYPSGIKVDWFVCNTKLVATASILGTEAHMIIEDKVSTDDFADALKYAQAYMSIDWAEGYNPNLEYKMKAEIKTVYVNGQLEQTFVNDKDVDDMSASNFLNQIGNAEAALIELKKHKAKSVFAKQEIARLKKFVKTNYQLLDANFGEVE